jgi:hypothetical protein
MTPLFRHPLTRFKTPRFDARHGMPKLERQMSRHHDAPQQFEAAILASLDARHEARLEALHDALQKRRNCGRSIKLSFLCVTYFPDVDFRCSSIESYDSVKDDDNCDIRAKESHRFAY